MTYNCWFPSGNIGGLISNINPRFTLNKTSIPSTFNNANELIIYNYTIINVGNTE